MKFIRYLFEYILIIFLFTLFKLLGYKVASEVGYLLGKTVGPFLRSKRIIKNNLIKFDNSLSPEEMKKVTKEMWGNYGRIFSEYPYIPSFRKGDLDKYIKIENIEKLEEIKKGQPVVFVSAHFSNFELMAMVIEKAGVNLAAIYRPLNNKMVNSIMEPLRKKHICKNQIKKGINGVRESLKFFKQGTSIAIMIDQRVSEGKEINFFNHPALTTTIPAQFVKKFGCKIQPVHIERFNKINFKITFDEQIIIEESADDTSISLKLNQWLEKKIKRNPSQWIWSHDRWK
ncbi:lysophospholipid acyltransferase family protein [Candidatus Pelagibacter communis]|uniref:lysophospholipid acyltransferase family protein n=1 Tax=Pelagibacter ubique TaxID=198252 RepID=UPI00094C6F98|nr:lipid A biosynthesis acyltransferase [Candidatus Pelagibacter ubique]